MPKSRTIGRVDEIEVKYDHPETAKILVELLRDLGFRSRPGRRGSDVIAFVPPLTAEERRIFNVRDEFELVKQLGERAAVIASKSAREYVAWLPGNSRPWRFRAHSLEAARAHARRHLGPTVDVALA